MSGCFVAICIDRPDGVERRKAARDGHLAFLESEACSIRLAGPFLDEKGTTMIGSMFIIEADSAEHCREILSKDAYASGGVFQSVEIRRWRFFSGDWGPHTAP